MEDEKKEKKAEEGAPGWIVTFADLMSLLLTFFVLLLSFAETDVKKFKEAAGSLKDAFGVQTDAIFLHNMSSITPFKSDYASGSKSWEDFNFSQSQLSIPGENFCQLEKQRVLRDKSNLEHIMAQLEKSLKSRISKKEVYLFMDKNELKVRLNMSRLFSNGTEKLKRPSVALIKDVLAKIDQQKMAVDLALTTYTNKKISSRDFSNWRLSTQRQLVLTTIVKNGRYRNVGAIEMQSLLSEDDGNTPWGVADIIVNMAGN